MTPYSTLPLELCEKVIDLVSDHHIHGLDCCYDLPYMSLGSPESPYKEFQCVLATCCLISHDWLPRARYRLYTAPIVHVSRVDLFYRSLSNESRRGSLVTRLVVHAEDRQTSHGLSLIPVVLPRLVPNLQFLSFRDMTISDLHPQFFRYLRQLSEVHTLICQGVNFSTPYLLAHLLASLPCLEHFVASGVRIGNGSHTWDQILLSRIREKVVIPHLELEDLDLMSTSYNPLRIEVIQSLCLVWKDVFACGALHLLSSMHSLRSLSIVVNGNKFYIHDRLLGILENIGHTPSPSLQTLNLQFQVEGDEIRFRDTRLQDQLYRIIISPPLREIHVHSLFRYYNSVSTDALPVKKSLLPWTHGPGEVTSIDVYEHRWHRV